MRTALSLLLAVILFHFESPLHAQFADPNVDREALPNVPAGFEVTLFAREPLVRHPCAMAFDAKGRLFVGMGPQWRNPNPQTPGDSVVIVLDTNGDGKADKTKTFATGFNCVQSIAWRGRDLYVANSPDLTIVRDLDGDDEADEYIRLFTDLGNLEHGLHGLNFGPDGKLYMSKGNSKGLTKPGRIAPKPFRELWGVTAPPDSPDLPERRTFTKKNYERNYHDPADDWGREGGVLRCDPDGRNLEIISRGFRNPWDITFDSGFNWLGTDNDQTQGDRVFMPFFGAHFGWNHPWSSHWSDAPHWPTAPSSGPMFEGSRTGVVYAGESHFPAEFRNVFFINDWLNKTTYVWRPVWDGALMRPKDGKWEPFAVGGKALYRPTDIEIGPDGALWILGWGSGYGANVDGGKWDDAGRVFRVAAKHSNDSSWKHANREKPRSEWTFAELIEDLDQPVAAWRIDAQDELVQRGTTGEKTLSVKLALATSASDGRSGEAMDTWMAWTLGRIAEKDASLVDWFVRWVENDSSVGFQLNLQIQGVRILGHLSRAARDPAALHPTVARQLANKEPRMRLAAVEATASARAKQNSTALLTMLATETDRVVFYAGWQALRVLQNSDEIRTLIADPRGGVRRAALLALLESNTATRKDLDALANDPDAGVREVLALCAGKSVSSSGAPRSALPVIPTGPSLARNIKARSGREYLSFPGGLQEGAKHYIDRDYALKQVPTALAGADLILTSNGDDGSTGKDFLSFEAIVPVRVFVGFDTRLPRAPSWARENFRREELTIRADHWTFQLYSREFAAGQVELGGNTDDGKSGGKSHYIVIIEPQPLETQVAATTAQHALALLDKGDAARGEILFKHRRGAGCVKCHSLGDRKISYGPELAGIGARAAALHLVQSITEPSAVITPGFTTQIIETENGETHTGILLEESGITVTLGLPTAEPVIVDKKQITARRTGTTSAMPALAASLSPQQVADLAAFLLTLKSAPATPAATTPAAETNSPVRTPIATPPAATAPVKEESVELGDWKITTEPKENRAIVALKGRPIATYIWQDREILRPYFAHVKTPSGIQVTRPHPATGEGSDHATMHPGIWLGFGSINDVDFWRNKGRVIQQRFKIIEEKHSPKNSIGFAVTNSYYAPDGKKVCTDGTRYFFVSNGDGYQIIVESWLMSADTPLTFGVQEEMGLGVRVPQSLTVKSGGGAILSDTGGVNEKGTWGKTGNWWDYHGKLEGKAVGLLVMTAPHNGEVWSHSRDYGVLVANPVRGKPVQVKAGEIYRLTFGVQVHEHDTAEKFDRLAAYQRFLQQVKSWDEARRTP